MLRPAMKLFRFDPADYREHYRRHGWVHVPGGLTDELLVELRRFVHESLPKRRVEGVAIAGKKQQGLWEPPDGVDFPGEVFDVVADTCGLNRETMTLSERHVKAYDPDADPEPLAHKDRFASQVSMGLSIDIPAESRLVLYPSEDVSPNPLNVSAALPASLPPERHPEVLLADAEEVEVSDGPGDVIIFRGSAIWHKRRQAAGAINLYLKMNDFGCDPLGEDPASEEMHRRTVEALSSDGAGLDRRVPVLSRRLDTITRQYSRDGWEETLWARVWEREPQLLSAAQFELLERLDGKRTVGDLAGPNGVPSAEIRALAERGVIDLI